MRPRAVAVRHRRQITDREVALMRKLTGSLTFLVVVLSCLGTVRAQGVGEQVIANIGQMLRERVPEFNCVKHHTPQGDPGPESPRGTMYSFKCQQKSVAVRIHILYGESKRDAEKALQGSQRLAINQSKRVEGYGEEAFELSEERFAWLTFRKGNVFAQIHVDIRDPAKTGGPSDSEPVPPNTLIEAARSLAIIFLEYIPAAE